MTELWSDFGPLAEIWFDGGYTSDMKDKITALLQEKQPDAVAFGGFGVSKSPVCWVGTESGVPPGDEIWTQGTDNTGDPTSQDVCPKGCDTTLQEGDVWFFEEGEAIRSLAELIDVCVFSCSTSKTTSCVLVCEELIKLPGLHRHPRLGRAAQEAASPVLLTYRPRTHNLDGCAVC